jgi:predicted ATP-dependent serine protease
MSRLLISRDEAAELPSRGVHALVYDSISEARQPVEACDRLTAWAKTSGGVVLMVCHATKAGEYRGPSTLQHWGDVEIQVSAAKNQPGSAHVQIKKSRVSPLGSATVPLVELHAV